MPEEKGLRPSARTPATRRRGAVPRLAATAAAVTLAPLALGGCGLGFGGNEAVGEVAAVNETCPSYVGFDADGDGWIDAAEFGGAGGALFAAWDDTGDGLLSFDEFNDCIGGRAEDLFARFDDNGDRMIDRAEFMDADLFAAWDGDGDRRLSDDELPLGDTPG